MIGLLLIGSYMLGNVLPALYAGGRSGRSVRELGSGNPGARNAGRVFGKGAFAAVLAADALKGALPVLAAAWLGCGPAVQLLVLLAVMLGHCFPAIHRFRGGKGAASFAGGLLAFDPFAAVPVVLLFAVLYPFMRRTTAAGVAAAAAFIPYCFTVYDTASGIAASSLIGLLLVTHRSHLPLIHRKGRPE
ncbi:glycerol-3-phosphate acyltransferase [Sporosarcina trichiuri]|uniref:glycerol-3-phosphate acyltransferase n=1 Tax=Sporosarcina trichiuri TaxID=3056445 RepID=UPI0025B5EFD4|nr:glycerol-3-phosphate acyltransferase [Sporosarcina sp. 0.2-SM1T-5]WJY26320.1 glycerol-3-phosphate acyltransferase [Sporosarcina sp. 0.2-SM1T-5]